MPECNPSISVAQFPLPRALPAFVGRAQELDALDDLLCSGSRCLTITGPGGIGKSRLAIEWASRLGNETRVAFLPTSHLHDARRVERMIAIAGSIDGWPDLPLSRLPEQLDLLLIVDGLDRVANAGSLLARVLARCPGVRVVATSRLPIGQAHESVLELGPLGDDGPALFRMRAGIASPSDDGIEHLCERLGGNPLAIELVAAQYPGRLFGQDAAAGSASCPLSEVAAWAIDGLTKPQQSLLRQLALPPGGFSFSTIRALAGTRAMAADQLESDVRALVDFGLLSGSPDAGYRLPRPAREVLLDQLAHGHDLAEARLEFARTMEQQAADMRIALMGAERDRALHWFALEEASLGIAFGTLLERHRLHLARKLLSSLWPFWVIREARREGVEWLDHVIVGSEAQDAGATDRELLFARGFLALLSGEGELARLHLTTAALPCCPRAQERWRSAALGGLAIVHVDTGDPAAAIGLCELFLHAESRRSQRAQQRFAALRTMVHLTLSRAHFQLGQLEDAAVHADFSASRALVLLDPLLQSAARLDQAAIALARSDWRLALNALADVVQLQRRQPQAGILSSAFAGLARIAEGRADLALLHGRLLGASRWIASAGAPLPPYVIPIETAAMTPAQPPSEAAQWTWCDALTLFDEAVDILTAASNPVPATQPKKGVASLTSRELEVLCLVAEDKTDQEVADILFISPRTVNDHMSHVISKLGVYRRTGAVVRALVEKWCD